MGSLTSDKKGISFSIPQKCLHTHLWCYTSHKSQDLETARCPSEKMPDVNRVAFYSNKENNKIMSFVRKWMELEIDYHIKLNKLNSER